MEQTDYTVLIFMVDSSAMTNSEIYKPLIPRRTTRHKIRGVDYAISEWGKSGDPLIIYLHGWGDTGSTFQFVVDEFRRDWFVVAPDWRGFGGSSAAASAYWFPDYLADLEQLLKHYSPRQAVRLVGHSMGGNVAGLYAGIMPERIETFVNIEGFGLPDSDPASAPARYRAWIEKGSTRPAIPEFADFSTLAKRIRRRSPRMTMAQAEFVAREWAAVGDDGRVRFRVDPAHKMPGAIAYRRAEAEACWRQVSADVLLVAGRDSDFGFGDGTRRAGAIPELPFPGVSTRMIEDAGHIPHFEQPRELARVIEAFFASSLPAYV